MNSAATLSPADNLRAATRQDFARQTAAAIRSAQAAKNDAIAANAADKERLRTLAAEIAQRELELDPENLSAIQELASRREQHSRLETKFAADGDARLADADKQLAAALNTAPISEHFSAEYSALVEGITEKLKPFVRDRGGREAIAKQTDAARELYALCYGLQNNPFKSPPQTDRILEALDGLANGNPPWISQP